MKKKVMLFASAIMIVGISGTIFYVKRSVHDALSKKENRTPNYETAEKLAAPAEHFAFMRSYPDKSLDHRAYNKMLTDNAVSVNSSIAKTAVSAN